MWFTPEVRRILAYSKPVDLRKSIDGLVGLVKSVLEEDPLSGSLVCVRQSAGELREAGELGSDGVVFVRQALRARALSLSPG